MKKLLIFTILLFADSCNDITVTPTYPAGDDASSKSYVFTIKREDYVAPTVFIQPYQRIKVNCYEQPCLVLLAGSEFTAKYDGKNFLVNITTSSVYTENTIKVDDHQYIEVRLANDAYIPKEQAFLTVTSLDESQRIIIQENKDNEFYSIIKFIAGAIVVVFVLFMLSGLFVKIWMENKKGGLTAEDILKHANIKRPR